MSYSYTSSDNSSMQLDTPTMRIGFSADPANRYYAEFLASGEVAAPYVAPPEPAPLTAQQKLENAGLTVDELKTLLGI